MTTPKRGPRNRTSLAMMYVGAGLTVIAALFPFVDRSTTTVLADHIKASYPAYQPGAIDAAVAAYLAVLSTIGVMGLLGWAGAIWAVRAGMRWAPRLAGGLLAIAICVAIAALAVRDTSGDVGLAPLLGWLLVLPCVPGLVAVALWRRAA
ncbi:hypothetical protein FHS43_005442 [Streptosporangium becharense]|uniref:Uncharacterized protein n=1 Tax=Streptosporangium becharense TaxID=1816182 RepID=A0A7W9IAI3_9ACTN|nr:hypothetical protein [Streptosporangium becharense]MBB2914130.1 hypothetical protein [Streptosporangium becharense]MBB5817157.1 hypothetical protein [Streptosporangium becharense]